MVCFSATTRSLRLTTIDSIDLHRQEAVQGIVNTYQNVFQYLTVRDCCSFECNSILLGSLLTAMVEQGLYFPCPGRPFYGYSVAELIRGVRTMKSPAWCVFNRHSRHNRTAHSCSLNDFFKRIEEQVDYDLRILSLYDFGLKSTADSALGRHTGPLFEPSAARPVNSV